MKARTRPPQSRLLYLNGLNGRTSLNLPSGKRNAEGWLQRRRASQQPWRRGRIRPSTCRDRSDRNPEP
jgi:hypothetical protein